MKKIYVVHTPSKSSDFNTFISQFTESLIINGYKSTSYIFPHSLRALVGRMMSITHFHIKCKYNNAAYLVPICGIGLDTGVIPWGLYSDIVPFLWDCWPSNQEKLIKTINLLKCKLVFVTSSQVQKIFQEKCHNSTIIYIPEGIDTKLYDKGTKLIERQHDIIEIGRQHYAYHDIVLKLHSENKIKDPLYNVYDSKGQRLKTMASNIQELAGLISQSKIAISFPHCDTNPKHAGNIETLTQRYWESMLSRNVIIGRAPKELIELIGYDPVINVDWTSPEKQLLSILNDINSYQPLVDKNYKTALEYAGWDKRIALITKALYEMGYIQ